MSKNYALSAYPLSKTYQEQLQNLSQDSIHFLLLSELRQRSIPKLWKYLRTLKPKKFFLVLEDFQSQELLPFLQILAMVSLPKEMILVDSAHQFKKIRIKDITMSCLKLVKATIAIKTSFYKTNQEMHQLLKQTPPKFEKKLKDSKSGVYLNANLWFGVKVGGSVGHIAGVANAIAQRGIHLDYIAVDKSGQLNPEIACIELPRLESFGLPSELNYYYYNQKTIDFISTNRSPAWEFIYQRMSISNYAGAVLSKKLNIPLVIEYNGSEAWVAKHWGNSSLKYHDAAIQAEEVCLKYAHRIVTISAVLQQELIERGVAPEKIVFYPNCIDPEIFNPERFSQEASHALRAQYQIAPDAMVFTFVGTFGQWHGVDVLAKAIKHLFESYHAWLDTHKVHFLLVGDGLKMAEVKNILGELIDSPYVTLTGLVPQAKTPAYLDASDVLLSPHVPNPDGSRFFGSPTKLFEYMAMGKAIIASDLEQIGDVLKHSIRPNQFSSLENASESSALGILCTTGSVDEIVDSIRFLAEHREWRELLGTNARHEALEKYTWDRHVDCVLQ